MKSIENKGITATDTLKNEVVGKTQMPEVRRREVTRAAFMAYIPPQRRNIRSFKAYINKL